jgi:cytidylate kinase
VALPKTIAIDGPAGSGKTSICFAVASELGYLFVDTGAFYRAVTLAAIREGIVEGSEAEIVALAERLHLDISADWKDDNRQYTILLNGEDVTWAVRDAEVEAYVSRIAAMGGVRVVLNKKYRDLAKQGSVIMAGRDIGTIVLPDADLKIYLDASSEARAERRYRQRKASDDTVKYEDVLDALRKRDQLDSQRGIAPMVKAADAQYVSTDNLTIEGVVEQVKHIIQNWQTTH